MDEPNTLKLKFRPLIAKIIKFIVESNIPGSKLVKTIKSIMKMSEISNDKSQELFQIIETEIMNLHEGNIARYKIRPSQFLAWKKLM